MLVRATHCEFQFGYHVKYKHTKPLEIKIKLSLHLFVQTYSTKLHKNFPYQTPTNPADFWK